MGRSSGDATAADQLVDGNGTATMLDDDEHELRRGFSGAAIASGDLYFRHHPFTKHFTAAIHSLLISCSRQEALSYFAHFQPRHQDFLYKVFTLTVTQINENVAAEFRSICKETQGFIYGPTVESMAQENVEQLYHNVSLKLKVLEALNHVNSEEFLRATDVRPSIAPKEVVRDVAVRRKQEEVNVLKEKLQQTKEQNYLLATHLEGLQEKVAAAKDLTSVDAVIEKISNINLKLEKVVRRNSFQQKTPALPNPL